MRLFLASRSPRRIELLREAGYEPLALAPDVDEHGQSLETPRDLVLRLAEAKARVAAARIGRTADPALVLAADTAVVIDGAVLGKPCDAADAAAMLRRLRGRRHEVLTGVFLLRTDDGRSTNGVDVTAVHFRDFDETTLLEYVASGEPMDKAGAYGIQGAGGKLVERIEGSWTNVVGLPMERLAEWVARLELSWRA